ncbi:hypothetical protein C2S53_007376 [Perilla frutescens var. hirtella]|uniref:Late embryogenesis abundant protein LEA-2 subgroup domain-containing protein n=1 Tax=Perilla frutescens var. hirtella TaxID=608512 RepID=A0AAD4JNU2_PERFH|nr:hypothetical protein C2S53_007376 [Perilla frutescens var. hirtella]
MAPTAQTAAAPRRRPFLRCIVLVILALIAVTGLVVLIIWAAVQPRKLKYSIEHGSITGFNLTNEKLNSDFDFVLRANNPNRRVSLYYDRIDVTVLYEDKSLSVNNVNPFYQPRRNVTFVDLDLTAKNAAVYGAMARDLKMERATGVVNLDVRIRAKIRLKVGLFKIHRTLKIECDSLLVPFDSRKGFERVLCHTDMDN